MSRLRTVNLEAGLPTVEEARRLLAQELRNCRREGVRVLKLIHGYGSSGTGGALAIGLRKSLKLRKKEKVIRDFFPGDTFSIFTPLVLSLLEEVPELRGDPDLNATNEGITVLWIR